ncbi:metallophosphoesterase family protein [Candidatus Woesearchaeota archaeon]|nr:metallophosphoesterase family protein [Candidatus Woesearchaeota archaeon]
MVRIALISDVHGNIEALEAVLRDIEKQHVDEIYFLGDAVGYGPKPADALERVLDVARLKVMGNHDAAIAASLDDSELKRYTPKALELLTWTNTQLTDAQREKLKNFQTDFVIDGIWGFHGTPWSYMDYLQFNSELPSAVQEDDYDAFKFIFYNMEKEGISIGAGGHSHIPIISSRKKGNTLVIHGLMPADIHDYRVELDDNRPVIVNVGSVGQPRDGDPRACYVIYGTSGEMFYRRVPYDIGKVQQDIMSITDLSIDVRNHQAKRLELGK